MKQKEIDAWLHDIICNRLDALFQAARMGPQDASGRYRFIDDDIVRAKILEIVKSVC